MTRVGTRPGWVLIALILVVLSLTACGDSSSSDSTATDTTAADGGDAAQNESADEDHERPGGDASSGKSSDGNGSSGAGRNVAAPLQVSGGGAAQFRVKGGDNSIQDFGEEGDESELQEVAEIVHGFLAARIEERWDTACSYMSKTNIEQLRQLVSQSPQFKGASCETALAAFTRPLPAAIAREATTVDAGSFRHDSEQGFLIYRGAEDATYAMPMRAEDGAWKVSAISSSAIG